MRLKNNYFYTLKENVKDEDSISGNLFVRSGMIKKSSSGIYVYLPLGYKVLKNIQNIVRDEMNKAGANELIMPLLIPEEVYSLSGRREIFGDSMFSLSDRYSRKYGLSPTHEEMFAEVAKMKIKSYKDMPFNLYQIGTKFRDEQRPRYGLIRVREFLMKDAYSFDKDIDGLNKSYNIMFDAYKKIFDRMKINYKIVTADTGAMGGLLSEEFQAITDIGEDVVVLCEGCNYSSNIEISKFRSLEYKKEKKIEKELVYTPGHGTIEEISKFLELPAEKFVKTILYTADKEIVACLIPGDREVNETKLCKLLGVNEISLSDFEEVERVTNAKVGFAGPIDLNVKIIIDESIFNMTNFIVGANKTDYHYKNVNLSDFKYDISSDIINVKENDLCSECGNKLYFKKGIEIGNTFKLGDKYSKSLNLQYLDEQNNLNYVQMGSYGIGIGRIMASIVEQNNDERGIIWPYEIAPYKVYIVVIDINDKEQMTKAERLYEKLEKNGIECILDDRDERAGVKFNDADLIGIPYRITIGKKISLGLVELKKRTESKFIDVSENNIINLLKNLTL